MIFVNATNPLISNETIVKAIVIYKNTDEFDSVNTVNSVKEFLWLNNKPMNYDPDNKPKSQDLPDIAAINHAVNIIDKKLMIERKDIFGHKPYLLKVNKIEAVDIDDEEDFMLAELMYKKIRGNL